MWWIRVIAAVILAVILIVATHWLVYWMLTTPPIPWLDEPRYRQLLEHWLYQVQPNPIIILLATVYMLAIVIIAVELISAASQLSKQR